METGMKIIGITGGVGSGKSAVLDYIEETYQAVICKTDEVGMKLQQPGQEAYDLIAKHFGSRILKEDGSLDREKLAAIVFCEKAELHCLNQIIHPRVKQNIKNQIHEAKEHQKKLFVVESALLLEDKYDAICDEIWYVYADEAVRRERLMTRRAYAENKINRIMKNQSDDEMFRKNCTVVIDNSGDFEKTKKQIDRSIERIHGEIR